MIQVAASNVQAVCDHHGSYAGKHDDRLYHLDMMHLELNDLERKLAGDTRIYLSLDCCERAIVRELLLMAKAQRRCQLAQDRLPKY
jgi:hypothetical protein